MSKPTPAAALRAYMDGTGELPFKFHETCEALLAYVERLESAIVEHAVSNAAWERSRIGRSKLSKRKVDRLTKAINELLALGREIAGRKP